MYMILSKKQYKKAITILICQILYLCFIFILNRHLYDMSLITVAKVLTKSILSFWLKL